MKITIRIKISIILCNKDNKLYPIELFRLENVLLLAVVGYLNFLEDLLRVDFIIVPFVIEFQNLF